MQPVSPSPDPGQPRCPACDAERITTAAVPCWMCGAMLPSWQGPMPAAHTATSAGGMPIALQVTLTAMMVLTIAGLFLEAPGIAILLVILLAPVAFAIWSPSSAAPGTAWGPRKIAAILGIIISAGVAGTIAYCAACSVGFIAGVVAVGAVGSGSEGRDLEVGMVTAIIAGSVAGLTVAILILRRLWRSPK